MFIVRVIISKRFELPFLAATAREMDGLADVLVVTRSLVAHKGSPLSSSPSHKEIRDAARLTKSKLVLQDFDGKNLGVSRPLSPREMEMQIRKSFLKVLDVKPLDVVLALDGDEVPFRANMQSLLARRYSRFVPLALNFHQFIYKPNYHWQDFFFRGPTTTPGWMKAIRRVEFRDLGFDFFKEPSGAHFTWQMKPEEMVQKLREYAHNDLYGHLADLSTMKSAIENKTYPFEPERNVKIVELGHDSMRKLIPSSILEGSGIFIGTRRDNE